MYNHLGKKQFYFFIDVLLYKFRKNLIMNVNVNRLKIWFLTKGYWTEHHKTVTRLNISSNFIWDNNENNYFNVHLGTYCGLNLSLC